MSRLLIAATAGYLLGMKHRTLCKELCWARMRKRARQLMRII
jgi:hypothetical protein